MTLMDLSNPPDRASHYFPLVDVLRGLAALAVLVFHVIEVGGWASFPTSGPLLLFRYGGFGVSAFLVISGFVVTLAATQAWQTDPRQFHREFAYRRCARIVPLYLLTGVAHIFLVNPAFLQLPWDQLFFQISTHLLFIHNLFPSTHGSIDGPNWSIALEMQFYLLIAMLIPWLVRVQPLKVLLLIPLAWAFKFIVINLVTPGQDDQGLLFFYSTQLPGMLDLFAVGIAMALCVCRVDLPYRKWFRPSWKNAARWAAFSSLATMAALAFFRSEPSYWTSAPLLIFFYTFLALVFGGLLATAITVPGLPTAFSRPWRYLGQISYGIYLWHMLVIVALVHAGTSGGMALLLQTLAGSVILASLSWHWLERPIISRAKAGSLHRSSQSRDDKQLRTAD